jgi:hypothetical protein
MWGLGCLPTAEAVRLRTRNASNAALFIFFCDIFFVGEGGAVPKNGPPSREAIVKVAV